MLIKTRHVISQAQPFTLQKRRIFVDKIYLSTMRLSQLRMSYVAVVKGYMLTVPFLKYILFPAALQANGTSSLLPASVSSSLSLLRNRTQALFDSSIHVKLCIS